ncbi:ATP-binding protein [Hellea balneolensis]|uniref:ATP-binding protein n=1 Tax=Hellea balneolensis TaxID=287478 RepID=UPI0006878496|nr:ATP-binding protein [Hellea balneolensis]
MTATNLLKRAQVQPVSKAYKRIEIGRVLTVGSAVAVMSINKSIIRNGQLNMAQIGTILKIITTKSIVVAMVGSLRIGAADDEGMGDGCIANLNILGEITTNPTTKETKFFRGVRSFPVLNEAIYNMSPDDLRLIFNKENAPCIEVGRLQQDNSIVAKVRTNDLLSKHFAIIGSTGSGKSCTVALVLQAILRENSMAHVVLFDPHNEYSKSFGNMAEVISNDSLDIPLWMFDFVETTELLTSDIEDHAREETEVLHDILLKAKRLYDRSMQKNDTSSHTKMDDVEAELQRATHITLDSPVPYRIRDVIKLLDHSMGKLENNSNLGPYKRLKRRIQMLMADPRYQFIFRNQAAPLPIENLVGRIFRIPVAGKPISILDFSGIPSEALNVVVSVVARLAFELATWSERRIPVLLVCEEAHRYIPADKSLGFHSTRRIIGRIAKEGRKYGVSLGIISQRPSELEASTLSQCSTIFSMRLSNELDQNFVRAAVPDGAAELLSFLPSLGTAETMVFGESVNLPMRVILNTLEEEYRPHSSSAEFTDLWNRPDATPQFMETVYGRWRSRSMNKKDVPTEAIAAPQRTVQTARHSFRQQSAVAPATSRQSPPRAPQNPVTASTAQMRQRLQNAASKSSSLSDVKSMLNTAFNRDM